MKKSTILIDFDGVLRHWSSKEISCSEDLAGVERGALLSVAFSREFLTPAVLGEITHEEWNRRVGVELTNKYNEDISAQLVLGWSNASWEVNFELAKYMESVADQCKIVLVTNATTKLPSDLECSGLQSFLDNVINSSEVGSAKPDLEIYRRAISVSETTIENSIFIDDSMAHVKAAISLGIDSIQHQNNADTIGFVMDKCIRQ